jgi:hypothetical protein
VWQSQCSAVYWLISIDLRINRNRCNKNAT